MLRKERFPKSRPSKGYNRTATWDFRNSAKRLECAAAKLRQLVRRQLARQKMRRKDRASFLGRSQRKEAVTSNFSHGGSCVTVLKCLQVIGAAAPNAAKRQPFFHNDQLETVRNVWVK